MDKHPRTTVRNAIDRPEKYLPGTGDNFVSNEVVVRGLDAARVRRHLTDTSTWESSYDDVADISFPRGGGPRPEDGTVFRFATFGFPPLGARVVAYQAPAPGVPGRLSWTAVQDGGPEERLDVPHARLVEDLPGGRVRVLTQETRLGRPAAEPAARRPDPMPTGTRRGWTVWSAPPPGRPRPDPPPPDRPPCPPPRYTGPTEHTGRIGYTHRGAPAPQAPHRTTTPLIRGS
ncbi:hypothetical protein ACIF8T_11000 [Streptomyces sp. NPDC085946]|uniref:hypothetical protein n=1 Tax=Streptomyces sp. NPDC085946 TaxID=3365744 RepID=UPI0037D037ED